MPEAIFAVLLVAFPLLGALTRSWAAVPIALAGWPMFYVGLDRGWWLDGTGDGWERAAVLFTVLGGLATGVGVLSGRALRRSKRPSPDSRPALRRRRAQ